MQINSYKKINIPLIGKVHKHYYNANVNPLLNQICFSNMLIPSMNYNYLHSIKFEDL